MAKRDPEELWEILSEYGYEYINEKMFECREEVAAVLTNYINESMHSILLPSEQAQVDFDIIPEDEFIVIMVLVKEETPRWMLNKLKRKLKRAVFDNIMKYIYRCYEEYNEQGGKK